MTRTGIGTTGMFTNKKGEKAQELMQAPACIGMEKA
jgi:hypothetical protein